MRKLQEVRLAKGFSQSQLAKASGVSLRMIQHYEQGFKDINHAAVITVIALADALECDVHEILEENTD